MKSKHKKGSVTTFWGGDTHQGGFKNVRIRKTAQYVGQQGEGTKKKNKTRPETYQQL